MPDELMVEAKTVAARRRTTLKALVEHALRREIDPSSSASPTGSSSDDLIEISEHGLPRLKRRGTGEVTTETIRRMMDEEQV